jgi:hypothetical protein
MYNDNNVAYSEKGTSLPEVERPDFSRILDSLQKQANVSTELSDKFYHISNGLKRIELKENDNKSPVEKEPECLIDLLWSVIWKIERANYQLEKIASHLQRTIGS